METTPVSDIAQSGSLLSAMSSTPPSAPPKVEERKISSLDVTAGVTKENKPVSVDTVSISSQALQSSSEIKKDEAIMAEVKKDPVADVNKDIKPKAATAGIQFIYNQKGDLITKYLDLSGKLIYQVPSKLMLLLRELSSKSNSFIDTMV